MAKYEKVHNGLGVKTLSHLILKEIYHRYGTKNLTNEQTKKCKIFERGISEKYDNFSENELNTKSNKNVYARSDVMTFVVEYCRDEEKKRGKKNRWTQKKLMIPKSEISQCSEYVVKSKTGNIFVNE